MSRGQECGSVASRRQLLLSLGVEASVAAQPRRETDASSLSLASLPYPPLTSIMEEEIPTVRPTPDFNPNADAETIRKAVKGIGTDEAAIISVLANRTSDERQIIITKYQEMYSRDLLSDLKSELSGHFKTVIVALLTPLPLFLAKELHYAMTGADTKEKTIVEILCTRDNASIKTIKEAYHEYYDKTLEESIEGNTSGHFRHFLLNICDCNRNETPCDSETAMKIAKEIAQALYEAGEDKPLTDEKFIYIMTRCSFYLLRFGFEEYNDTKDRNFGDFIEAECSEGIKYSLMTLYLIIMNRAEFFAKELHEAMREMGTRDKAIIRLVVSRSEIDLGNIKLEYQKLYDRTLVSELVGEISGDYKTVMVAIIRE